MYICPHVHFRDEKEEAHKETIEHGLWVATRSGFDAVIDMPNTTRPVISRERVKERLALAQRARENNPRITTSYHVHVGLTADLSQIEEAVRAYNEIDQVAGMKLFAGRSIGNLAVIKEDDQKFVFNKLAELRYNGPVVVHAEKEKYMNPEIFDPTRPITHAYSRPPLAAIESVKDMITFSADAGFEGHLHIAHVSTSEEVYLVQEAKRTGRKISCGITPHHFMLHEGSLNGYNGLLYKMNPPLRSDYELRTLNSCVLRGEVDLAETDHAPHTLAEKTKPPYLSGMPGLWMYHHFIRLLLERGMKEKDKNERTDIDRFTFRRANEIFGKNGNPLVSERIVREIEIVNPKEYPMDPRFV